VEGRPVKGRGGGNGQSEFYSLTAAAKDAANGAP